MTKHLGLSIVAAGLVLAACEGPAGPAGANGTTGTGGAPCWEGLTDQNSDGVVDVLDCRGEDGTDGTNGTSGTNGTNGTAGTNGTNGTEGIWHGNLSGTVTNALSHAALENVAVDLDPMPASMTLAHTSATGTYGFDLPIGTYTVTFSLAGYPNVVENISIVASSTLILDVALSPTAPFVVSIAAPTATAPGGNATLTATATAYNGASSPTYAWTQTAGPTAAITGSTTTTASITLANTAAYKAALMTHLEQHDRNLVLGINPFALEEAGHTEFKVTVTAGASTYTKTVTVPVTLPWAVAAGIRTLPRNIPVLLNAMDYGTYDWAITTQPAGTADVLTDATTRNPYFVPTKTGVYELSVSDATMHLYVDNYSDGVITGVDANGDLTISTACTACHDDATAPDQFTPWAKTGHAEIFSANLDNPAGHWSNGCATCHGIGVDGNTANGGMDAKMATANWTAPSHGEVGYYAAMFDDVNLAPIAKAANIQCENCHGPQGTMVGHNKVGTDPMARTSLGSEVCATCHGEPKRHARFQQWELSGHSNYELAEEEGDSSNCGRCHSAEGFLAWLPRLLDNDPSNDTASLSGFSNPEPHPTTCVVCHDPHSEGTTTGEPNNADMRISGNTATLLSGYGAVYGAGRGAICMTCHSGRRGLQNDDVPRADTYYSTPHGGFEFDGTGKGPAQVDALMGQNAYFVDVGERSPHSYIQDTCAYCHMVATPPPADYSNNFSGTNHTFKADLSICADCHGDYDGAGLQNLTKALGQALKDKLGEAASTELANRSVKFYTGGSHGAPQVDYEVTSGTIAHVEMGDGMVFNMHFASAVAPVGGGIAVSSVEGVGIGSVKTMTDTVLWTGNTNLVKAWWNYCVMWFDGSYGVHNPSWTLDMLQGAIDADVTLP